MLRFVAAMLVLVSHAYYLSWGESATLGAEPLRWVTRGAQSLGDLGLAIFFILSGFLVTRSFEQRRTWRRFLWARSLRIFPALVVVVVLCALVLGPLVTSLSLGHYFDARQTYVYLSNVSLVWPTYTLPGVFLGNAYPEAVNGSLWTLRYEFGFYLVVAATGWLVGLRTRRWILVVAVLLAFCLAATTLPSSLMGPLSLVQTGARLFMWFGAGMLLFLFRESVPLRRSLAVVSALILVLAARAGGYGVLFPFFGSYLVIYLAYSRELRVWGFGKYGDFSYGMYLYAFPIQQTVVGAFGGAMAVWTNLLLSIPLTLVCALASWHLVEKRCLRLKDVSGRGTP